KFYRSSAFPGSAEPYNTLHNAQLKPEMTNSTEAGINVALFSNRLTADVNFYYNRSRNQLLTVPLDVTTGFSSAFVNGGLITNKGWEVRLTGTPVRNENFQWNASINWAMNDNEILELSEGVLTPEQIVTSSGLGSAELIARVGGSPAVYLGYG